MNTIAIIDLETSSLDAKTGHVIEAALCLYSIPDADVIRVRSWLVSAPAAEVEKTRHVHGISPAMAERHGVPFEDVTAQIHNIVTKEADVLGAYNAEFERAWLGSSLRECKPWVCLMSDVEYPLKSGKSLLAVAHVHGLQIGSLHRATDDVLLAARVLARCSEMGVSVAEMIDQAMRPKSLFMVADTSFDEARNAQAREAGFRFVRERGRWEKRMTAEAVAGLPFAVKECA